MEIDVQAGGSDFPKANLQAGTYYARLVKIEEGMIPAKQFKNDKTGIMEYPDDVIDGKQPVYWWRFDVGGVMIDGMSTRKTAGERSKFRKWAAAMGCPLPDAGRYDTASMYGRQCQVAVVGATDKDGKAYSKVGDVFAMPVGAPAPVAAAASEDVI